MGLPISSDLYIIEYFWEEQFSIMFRLVETEKSICGLYASVSEFDAMMELKSCTIEKWSNLPEKEMKILY